MCRCAIDDKNGQRLALSLNHLTSLVSIDLRKNMYIFKYL